MPLPHFEITSTAQTEHVVTKYFKHPATTVNLYTQIWQKVTTGSCCIV